MRQDKTANPGAVMRSIFAKPLFRASNPAAVAAAMIGEGGSQAWIDAALLCEEPFDPNDRYFVMCRERHSPSRTFWESTPGWTDEEFRKLYYGTDDGASFYGLHTHAEHNGEW